MNKRAITTAAVAVAVVLLVIAYLWRPSQTPVGQAPFLTLSAANFNEFSAAFDAESDVPRMLLLLSPT